jgi:hypothetical protein
VTAVLPSSKLWETQPLSQPPRLELLNFEASQFLRAEKDLCRLTESDRSAKSICDARFGPNLAPCCGEAFTRHPRA